LVEKPRKNNKSPGENRGFLFGMACFLYSQYKTGDMKNIIKHPVSLLFSIIILTTIITSSCSSSGHTTASTNTQEVIHAIDSSQWTFTPLSVSPQSGRSQQINGSYSVTYNKGKLIVYLPYFGRAYSAVDYGTSKSPLDFTSIDFEENKLQSKSDR
jgi:Domain of unknown function (DUF4251)